MPSSTSAPGVWKIKEIANFIQDDSWPSIGDRACFAGGDIDSYSNVIDFVQISSDGNATDFGDLTEARQIGAQNVASNVRGCFAGGYGPSAETDTIEYITIKTTGNATDFGNLVGDAYANAGASNSTRGLFTGQNTPAGWNNQIEYITIASTGNATDFGDATTTDQQRGACSSTSRAVFAGGNQNPSGSGGDDRPSTNVMDYVTIASTGNATDFGDLTVAKDNSSGAGSSTRALFGGGGTGTRPTRPPTDNIDYITIASTGNATDFGNLTSETTIMGQGTNKIRALFAGGQGAAPGYTKQNKIDKVTIASTGNASDFGDLTVTRRGIGSANNFHGGI